MHSGYRQSFSTRWFHFIVVFITSACLLAGCKQTEPPDDGIPRWVKDYPIECPADAAVREDDNSKYCIKLGKPHGTMMKWYPSGKKYQKSHYANGKENGDWVEWYQNGKKRNQAKFSLIIKGTLCLQPLFTALHVLSP